MRCRKQVKLISRLSTKFCHLEKSSNEFLRFLNNFPTTLPQLKFKNENLRQHGDTNIFCTSYASIAQLFTSKREHPSFYENNKTSLRTQRCETVFGFFFIFVGDIPQVLPHKLIKLGTFGVSSQSLASLSFVQWLNKLR